jgi:hypothetical protein
MLSRVGLICIIPVFLGSAAAQTQELPMPGVGGRIVLAQRTDHPVVLTAQQAQIPSFQQLPREIHDHAIEVRKSCAELAGDNRTFDDMQGIDILDLKGDGSWDIIVDNEGLCGSHMAGANCGNRGCDMKIYKEISKGAWRKIFDEHLYAKFLAIDWENMRLQLMVVSIYAGDPRCRPEPSKEYTSGKSCNLIVTYKDNRWNWQLIR